MDTTKILIVDDEKNIRLTLSRSLKLPGYLVDTAINGEEALQKLKEQRYHLVLLDLKLPGMDGIEVLRQIRQLYPFISVIIITAYGTIDSAVEVMKLGAIDFIQKPFTPDEIRDIVVKVLGRNQIDETQTQDYAHNIELAKKYINSQQFNNAFNYVKKALSLEPANPEAFNILGLFYEIKGDILSAQKNYRAALALDPTYRPARKNLDRLTTFDEHHHSEEK